MRLLRVRRNSNGNCETPKLARARNGARPTGDKHAGAGVVLRPVLKHRGGGASGGQWVGKRQGHETGTLILEGLGDTHGFGTSKGTDGVNEPASWFHRGGGVAEEPGLQGAEFLDVVGGNRPTRMRVTLPGADAAARGIHEDAVESGFGWELWAAVPEGGSVIKNAGTGGAMFEFLEAPGGRIAGPNQAFVFHQIRQVQQFAALAGTGIPPRLTGNGRANEAHSLGTEVLQFELAGVKRGRAEQILVTAILQGISEGALAEGPAILQKPGQFPALPTAGAEPETWRGLQGSEPSRSNLHYCFKPSRHSMVEKVVIGELFRPGGESVGKLEGALDLVPERRMSIEPSAPAVEGENGLRD